MLELIQLRDGDVWNLYLVDEDYVILSIKTVPRRLEDDLLAWINQAIQCATEYCPIEGDIEE